MTTQREIAEQLGLPIHPPKVETFDLTRGTNTDPKKRAREVDEFRVESFGLYMARSTPGHARLRHVESWLLPDLGLRVSRWRWWPGHEQDLDYYLDVAEVTTGSTQWHTVDHYLDIEVGDRRWARLRDIDEFALATGAGLLDTATAQRALETAYDAVDGLARHGYDLDRWLREKGVDLSWQPQPTELSTVGR
ncbi:ribonuclease FAU-1 family protein [Parasphingorhabdus pacifica]